MLKRTQIWQFSGTGRALTSDFEDHESWLQVRRPIYPSSHLRYHDSVDERKGLLIKINFGELTGNENHDLTSKRKRIKRFLVLK